MAKQKSMKTLKFYLSVFLLALSVIANAQYISSKSKAFLGGGTESIDGVRPGLRFSCKIITMDWSGENKEMYGFSADYVHPISLSANVPLFLETGIGYQYSTYDAEIDISMHSLNVPLNLGYVISVSEKFSMTPYIGLNLRSNLSADASYETYYGGKKELDLFDDEDMETPWNKFQIGLQFGFGLNLNWFYLGLGYGIDLNELGEELKLKSLTSTIGFNF